MHCSTEVGYVQSIGLQGVLNVALSYHTEMTDNLDGGRSEHVVLLIRKGLRRGHDNRVTGVDTQRIEVLHVTHGDAVVLGVANDFILGFLPALETLLYQDLGRE